MEWPGNLPDLNPIEELWKLLGDRTMQKKLWTQEELINDLIHVWHHELDVNNMRNLVESMPWRCSAVIQVKGGSTKY